MFTLTQVIDQHYALPLEAAILPVYEETLSHRLYNKSTKKILNSCHNRQTLPMNLVSPSPPPSKAVWKTSSSIPKDDSQSVKLVPEN